MTDFTRLTIVGSVKRATIVVPSDESIGALIPRLMELLGEQVASVARPLTLLRLTGEQLDPVLSTAEQAVGDGEVLRLLRLDEAPPPPEVSDVTDTVSETLGTRAGLWSAGHRTVLGAGAVGALALVAGLEAEATDELSSVPAIVWVVAVLVGMGLALAGRRSVARVLLGVSLGLAVPLGQVLTGQILGALFGGADGTTVMTRGQYDSWTTALVPSAVLLVAWVSLLLVLGFGRRSRPAILGSAVGAIGSAVALALSTGFLAAGSPVVEAEAIVAVAAVVGVGLVPWYAMSASGLTGLDDQVMTGTLADRRGVLATVGDAYRALTWTTFALAGVLAAALVGLAQADPAAPGGSWRLGLGAAIVLVAALRTRAFPLAAQGWALWLAILIPVVFGLWVRLPSQPGYAAAALAGVAVVVAVLVTAQPARHQRASFRRVGNVLESLSVIALVPLLLGSFGVFGELLAAFR